jgi:hypothetical protein
VKNEKCKPNRFPVIVPDHLSGTVTQNRFTVKINKEMMQDVGL